MRRFTCWIAVLLVAAPLAAAPLRPIAAIQRVVIISIDGLRPDLLLLSRAGAIRDLIEHGSYTFWARTVAEGYTVPSHVSMLTGVAPSRHGVTWDNHIEEAYPEVPTLFDLAHRAGYGTAMAVGKTKLIVFTRPGSLDHTFIANETTMDAFDVAEHAVAFLRTRRPPEVLFVHFADVDVVGHASGWGSREQLQALEKVDRAVGRVRQALHARRLTSSTAIFLTADHGGIGRLHPPEDPASQFIPWIVAGPSVRERFDLSRIEGLQISTMATFATACALLGLETPEPIDARPLLEIFDRR
jgi:predicted AlkP superfamily pyrophosphatase or phosphodiesterase